MLVKQVAKHFKDVHFGGNWTTVNLKDLLTDVTWQEATTQLYQLNTIAVLVFHMNYYVAAVLKVLQGEALDASDKYSFDLEPVTNEEQWQALINKALADATLFTHELENLPEERLLEDFTNAKYGNYYRNLSGIIEHTHYHLGQIALIKKIIREKAD